MSTLVYGSAFVELYSTLLQLPAMQVDAWLERYATTVRFLAETRQQNYLANYILQQARERCADRYTIKYFHLIDKLMRTCKSFLPSIQSILVELYTMVFVTFWQRGFHGQVEELKILRKFWLGTVSLPILHMIRQRIIEFLDTDIETGFRKDIIDTIEHYYRNSLRLDDWQIYQNLPTVTLTQLQAKTRQLYNYNYHQAVLQPVQQQQEASLKRQREHSFQEERKQPPKVRVMQNQGGKKAAKIQLPATPKPQSSVKSDKLSSKPDKKRSDDLSLSSAEVGRVKPSRSEEILKKVKELASMGRFRCHKCGVFFGEERSYDQHLRFHFQQNLQRYDMKVRKVNVLNRASCSSLELWLNPHQSTSTQDLEGFFLPLAQLPPTRPPLCNFCGESFQTKLLEKQGTWAYVNCISVNRQNESPSEVKLLLHKDCFDVMQPSQNDTTSD